LTVDRLTSAELGEVRDCPNCGAHAIHVAVESHRFMYGAEKPVELVASYPVWTCASCGFNYKDGRAEEIEHVTVCRHLGLLTPQEIRDFRKRHGLSRLDLVRLTRLGEASLKRYETGAVLQNASIDRFLRLIDDPEVMKKLKKLNESYLEPNNTEVAEPQRPAAVAIKPWQSPWEERTLNGRHSAGAPKNRGFRNAAIADEKSDQALTNRYLLMERAAASRKHEVPSQSVSTRILPDPIWVDGMSCRFLLGHGDDGGDCIYLEGQLKADATAAVFIGETWPLKKVTNDLPRYEVIGMKLSHYDKLVLAGTHATQETSAWTK